MNIYTCEKTKLGTPDGNPWRYDRICGPYWRIYWNDAPGASVTVGGRTTELGPDRVVALAPRTVYSTRAESPSTHFYMHFTEDAPYSELKPGVFVFEEPRLVELAREIAGELDGSEGLPTRLMLKANIYLSEALLAIPPERMPEERPLDRRVKRALDLMDGRPGISLEELAGELNMCRNAFINLFRRETGATPQKTAMKRRLERACMLLHFSQESVKRIASLTGFCDRYHFSRAFKSEYGCGPASFRKRMKI